MIIARKSDRMRSSIVVALGVIAAVAGAVVVVFVPRLLSSRRVDAIMAKNPALRQIERWEPASYRKIRAETVAALLRGDPSEKAEQQVRAAVATLSKPYIVSASDEALVEYMRLTMDELRQIYEKKPLLAYEIMAGRTNADTSKYVDAKTSEREEAALAEIIRTGVAHEGSYNQERAKAVLKPVMDSMIRDYGDDAALPSRIAFHRAEAWEQLGDRGLGGQDDEEALRSYEHPDDYRFEVARRPDERRTCEVLLEFYNRVLALPPDQAAQALRKLLSHT